MDFDKNCRFVPQTLDILCIKLKQNQKSILLLSGFDMVSYNQDSCLRLFQDVGTLTYTTTAYTVNRKNVRQSDKTE
jgi:hypothetical protein